MSGGPARVAAVVRHREAVLVCREPGSAGPLALPTRPVGTDAPELALRSLLDELGFDSAVVERRGAPVETADGELVPFQVAVADRSGLAHGSCPEPDWFSPSELPGQSDSWRAYEAVAPTGDTIASDAERGSTAIATDALWVLRDAATSARRADEGLAPVESAAVDLLEARPSMAALANRVHRTMADAETPAAVERAATAGIVRAFEADAAAAALAAETVAGSRVLTLSRSGSVRSALLEAQPEVEVLASRPGGEGLDVAAALADAGLAVSTVPDADVYDRLRSGAVDAVLVGADAVTPDGGLINKVGTRAAALAAEAAGVPFYAVCASDKVRPTPANDDPDPPPLEPRFDLTPPRLVTALLTDRGRLTPEDIPAIADAHRSLAAWRE